MPCVLLEGVDHPECAVHESEELMQTLYLARFIKLGGVWKLEFGPKAFLVVSDPVVVRHLLKVQL